MNPERPAPKDDIEMPLPKAMPEIPAASPERSTPLRSRINPEGAQGEFVPEWDESDRERAEEWDPSSMPVSDRPEGQV